MTEVETGVHCGYFQKDVCFIARARVCVLYFSPFDTDLSVRLKYLKKIERIIRCEIEMKIRHMMMLGTINLTLQ